MNDRPSSEDIWDRLWRRIVRNIARAGGLKGQGRKPDAGGVPVSPNRPNTLSGGAAAPLEYDD